jgi:hypothetical protein
MRALSNQARATSSLAAPLFALLLAGFALEPTGAFAQPAITISPAQAFVGTSVTLTVTPAGGFDLSNVTSDQVAITPPDGITNLIAITSTNSSNLTVEFSLDASAKQGTRTLIVIKPGNVVASTTFTVTHFVAECPSGQTCCRRDRTTHACITSSCSNQCGPPSCSGEHKCCQADPDDLGRCLSPPGCIPISQSCPQPDK